MTLLVPLVARRYLSILVLADFTSMKNEAGRTLHAEVYVKISKFIYILLKKYLARLIFAVSIASKKKKHSVSQESVYFVREKHQNYFTADRVTLRWSPDTRLTT